MRGLTDMDVLMVDFVQLLRECLWLLRNPWMIRKRWERMWRTRVTAKNIRAVTDAGTPYNMSMKETITRRDVIDWRLLKKLCPPFIVKYNYDGTDVIVFLPTEPKQTRTKRR